MILKCVLFLVGMLVSVAVIESILAKFHNSNEASRKLVHVAHGLGLAGLAFIAPLDTVIVFELVFLAGMVVARYVRKHFEGRLAWVHYLSKMYRVGRLSYGDIFFPISAMIAALIAHSKWEFAAAMLVLGLADAAAALVGKRLGKKSQYKVFGQTKSVAGSAAFYAVTCLIVGVYAAFVPEIQADVAVVGVLTVSAVLTATENLGVYGSDNFLIPIVAVLALNIAA